MNIIIKGQSFYIIQNWPLEGSCPWCGKTVKAGKGVYTLDAGSPYCGMGHAKQGIKAKKGL
jgi:hypothetical protein